jgi:hypothetical protein
MLRKNTNKVRLISIKFCNFDQCTISGDEQHQIWDKRQDLAIGLQDLAVRQRF